MRIVYAYADHPGEGSCSDWLCRFPASALQRAGYDVTLQHVTSFVESPPDADIIVVERLLWNGSDPVTFDDMPDGPTKSGLQYMAGLHVLDTIEECQEHGSKVIAVFDDHLEAYPDTHHALHDRWLLGQYRGIDSGFIPIMDFGDGLGLVDAVITPSAYLSGYYGRYAKRMYRIHNRPELSLYPVMPNGGAPHRLAVGWGGSSQHELSWRDSNVLGALERLKKYIVLIGHFPGRIADMLDERGIDYQHGGWVEYDLFPQVVAAYDIGICPLAGEYDRGRSWIKWLECSLMGKPVVADDLGNVYSDCVGGVLVHTEDEWYNAILSFMDKDNYMRASRDGLAWAWNQGWDNNLVEITDIFEEVLG